MQSFMQAPDVGRSRNKALRSLLKAHSSSISKVATASQSTLNSSNKSIKSREYEGGNNHQESVDPFSTQETSEAPEVDLDE